MLKVEGLRASVAGREVLHGVDLEVPAGEVHLLLGPNAAGKTTLLSAIMGLPHVQVTDGRVFLGEHEVTLLPPWERAMRGLALAFQIPPEFRGLKLSTLLEKVAERHGTTDMMGGVVELLRLDGLLDREAFRGFSGGERKRAELAVTLLQKPRAAMLDEPDSGVDLESVGIVASAIERLARRGAAVLVVTHTSFLAERLDGEAHILLDGVVKASGPAREMLERIREYGFGEVDGGGSS